MLNLPPEMIQVYVSRRFDDLRILEEALAAQSVEPFQRIGHQLMGNARNFGFPELEALAREMEALTANRLTQEGPRLIAALRQWTAQKSSSPAS